MAATPYTIGDLAFNGLRVKSVTGTENFQMKVWGGSLRVNITKEKEFKPIFERALTPAKVTVVKKMIEKIKTSSPGTKLPIVFSEWDRVEKKSAIDFVLTFLKDDKNMYHVEMQWKGNKYDCLLKGPFGISYGSDPMSEADKSAIELDTMLDWLNTVMPMQVILSNKKREFDASANGKSYNANNNSKPAADADPFFD